MLSHQALIASGIPTSAINLVSVPSELGLFDDVFHIGGQLRLGTHFEVVLRLFRFHNQTDAHAYLHSSPPVFYLRANHDHPTPLPGSLNPSYASRYHPASVSEAPLFAAFEAFGATTLSTLLTTLSARAYSPQPIDFTPLYLHGLDCLEQRSECLGDCPDAAYFGPNVRAGEERVDMLQLREDEVHLITLVHHRRTNASVYGSIALLRPHPSSSAVLNKSAMSVRATPLGFTSFEFNSSSNFVAWAFTRSRATCEQIDRGEGAGEGRAVDGCSVVDEQQVPRDGYLTYCERAYLNPLTGRGPLWSDLLPARLYRLRLPSTNFNRPDETVETASTASYTSVTETAVTAETPFPVPTRLPRALPLASISDGSETMRFFHIIKTGGESLELHLARQPSPRLNYSHCRRAGFSPCHLNLSSPCALSAAGISVALCAANCECCADDARVPGGFNGLLIRSPRAHVLSLFSHCHTAHTANSWSRIADDLPQYLAELALRGVERACASYCGVSFNPDWGAALEEALRTTSPERGGERKEEGEVRVLPLHNTQAHALTCSKARGSLGQHFRTAGDGLLSSLDAALASLRRFEWVGITDLFDHSLCLLHFQANGSLPAACDCSQGKLSLGLPRFNHGVRRREPASLSAAVLSALDAHTEVDAQVFAAGLRLLLGRLRTVEERTGRALLQCIDWERLWRTTGHIPGLWDGPHTLHGEEEAHLPA
ncbi:MAG: hypothetical protein SGPRY_010451 [Prymnesium sp.]